MLLSSILRRTQGRLVTVLSEQDIVTIADLMELTDLDVRKLHGVGKKNFFYLNELRKEFSK